MVSTEKLTRSRWYFYMGLASMFAGWFVLDLQDSFPEHPILFYSGALFGMGVTSSIVYGPRLLIKKQEGKIQVKPLAMIKDKQSFKEKLLILSILGVLFLPVRLIFYHYITDSPTASIGMVSAIGITFIILAEKNKLGKIGRMWKKHMHSLVYGRLGKMYVIITAFVIPFLVVHLYWLDVGMDGEMYDQRQRVLASIIAGSQLQASVGNSNAQYFLDSLYQSNVVVPDADTLAWAMSLSETQRGNVIIDTVGDPLKLMPFFLSLENEATQGWIGHMIIISLVGEAEGIGLFIIYRKIYKPQISQVSEPVL